MRQVGMDHHQEANLLKCGFQLHTSKIPTDLEA